MPMAEVRDIVVQRIYVNIDDVRTANGKLARNAYKIDDVSAGVLRIKSRLDTKILARKSIGVRINRASGNMQRLEDRLRELNSFVSRSMESYWAAERRISKTAVEANKIKSGSKQSFWDYAFANTWESTKSTMSSYATWAAAKNLLKIADGVNFKLYRANGKVFIKLIGEAMTRPADYLKYRNLLIDKLGGESGDWKKGYVKRLMNKGIALYDEYDDAINNRAAFRQAMHKYSSTALAPLNQYVKNLAEPWYKVMGSVAKTSMIDNLKAMAYEDYIGWKGAAANIKISKGLGALGTIIMVGENAKSAYEERSFKKFALDTGVDVGYGLTAMAAGAAVGSMILPPAGTIVGAVAAGVVNTIFNWKFEPDKKSMVDVTKDFVNDPGETLKGIGKGLDKIFW